MKTAIEEIIAELDDCLEMDLTPNAFRLLVIIKFLAINKLEKEKQQIKNAYIIGYSDCHSSSAKDQDLYFKLLYNDKDI